MREKKKKKKKILRSSSGQVEFFERPARRAHDPPPCLHTPRLPKKKQTYRAGKTPARRNSSRKKRLRGATPGVGLAPTNHTPPPPPHPPRACVLVRISCQVFFLLTTFDPNRTPPNAVIPPRSPLLADRRELYFDFSVVGNYFFFFCVTPFFFGGASLLIIFFFSFSSVASLL